MNYSLYFSLIFIAAIVILIINVLIIIKNKRKQENHRKKYKKYDEEMNRIQKDKNENIDLNKQIDERYKKDILDFIDE